jgi:hypothetical protein
MFCGAEGNWTLHRLLAKRPRQPWYMLPQIKLNEQVFVSPSWPTWIRRFVPDSNGNACDSIQLAHNGCSFNLAVPKGLEPSTFSQTTSYATTAPRDQVINFLSFSVCGVDLPFCYSFLRMWWDLNPLQTAWQADILTIWPHIRNICLSRLSYSSSPIKRNFNCECLYWYGESNSDF